MIKKEVRTILKFVIMLSFQTGKYRTKISKKKACKMYICKERDPAFVINVLRDGVIKMNTIDIRIAVIKSIARAIKAPLVKNPVYL